MINNHSQFGNYDEGSQQSIFQARNSSHLEFQHFDCSTDKHENFDLAHAKITGELSIYKPDSRKNQSQKATYFLINQNLCEVQDLKIVKNLNIEFCKFDTLIIDTPQQGSQRDYPLYAFQISKNSSSITFIAEDQQDVHRWELALETYLVKNNIEQYYKIQDQLGSGSYSKVFHGLALKSEDHDYRNKCPQKVAIKRLEKSKLLETPDGIASLVNEIKVHWELYQCQNISKLFQIFESTLYIYLVLELQTGGSLLSYIIQQKTFQEGQIKNIMEQLFLAVDFMHQKKIIHRDLKLDNILVHQVENLQYDVRIADFGLAIFTFNDQPLQLKCGTPGYVAPEMIRGQGYSYKADIFSLGSLLFNLFTGRYLFAGKDKVEILKNNAHCDVSSIFVYLQRVSGDALNLLFQLLEADPRKRPTCREALEHVWFKNDQQIIHDLLNVNDSLCQHVEPKEPALHLNIHDQPKSFSSFRCGSNIFQNYCNALSGIKNNESLVIQARGRAISNQVSDHSSGENRDGSQSPDGISYYNALKDYREKSKGRSFLERHYNKDLLPVHKSNSTPMQLQFSAIKKKEQPKEKKYSQFKRLPQENSVVASNEKIEESLKDQSESIKEQSSIKEAQVPNDVQDVDDIQLSNSNSDNDNEMSDLIESEHDLGLDSQRAKISTNYDDVKMPSSMLMSRKNELQINRIFI